MSVTSREFDVLFFLVPRAGQVLSKRAILDGVWSDDFEGDPNIVEVYVARLRRKLAAHASLAAIDTVGIVRPRRRDEELAARQSCDAKREARTLIGLVAVVGYILVMRVFYRDSKALDSKIDLSKMKEWKDDD